MGKYVIGIDGGGTASKGVVADLYGNVIARFIGGPTNYLGNDREVIDRSVSELFTKALAGREVEDCAAICLGSAGVSSDKARENLERIIRKTGFTCPYLITTDSHTAHAGALSAKEGIVVIAGTGSICLARKDDGQTLRVGGFGHLIDDVGSGYYIGNHILQAVVRSIDGRGRETMLKNIVYRHLGIETQEELISWIYAPERSKKDIASLSALIADAAGAGDEAAVNIEKRAAVELCDLCEPAIKFFDRKARIALSGSVLQKNNRIRTYFMHEMQDRYFSGFGTDNGIRVVMAENEADYGAMLLALQLI